MTYDKMAQALGDCYEAAGKYMMDQGLLGGQDHLLLVHGEVQQQVPPFLRYGHAWIEEGETVIDVSNGKRIEMPRMLYYALGQVRQDYPPFETNMHKYTVREFQEKVREYEHWGPWDLETCSGY